MFSKPFFVLAILASCALAQDSTASADSPSPSVPAGITPCILQCIQPAAEAVGCNFTDASCVCTNSQFQQQAQQCLEKQCTQEDVQTALGLQAQECGAIGATPPPSASASASATGSEATESTTRPASSSAGASATTLPGSSAGQSSHAGSTTTAPPKNSSSGAASTSASAHAQSPSNAAMGKGDGMGLMGLVVAGIFGLAL